ncbi:MAG: GNAT family N-acetyltransferase [Caldilineaceae bacterium]|nr:GNAT family N-acetyltransferase [Caldilineaceae bacterium]
MDRHPNMRSLYKANGMISGPVTVFTQPITDENWLHALDLTIHSHQSEFVPTVALSLAKAYIQPNGFCYDPYGIYHRQRMSRQLVGFYSFIHLPNDLSFCYLGGFFIDRQFQGQGYGKAALIYFLDWVRCNHVECREVLLSVHPENHVAIQLYRSQGFVKTGEWLEEEAVMRLAFSG